MSFKVAKSLVDSEKYEEASKLTSEILENEPDNVKVLVLHGAIQLRLKMPDEALKTFSRAQELEPSNTYVSKGILRCLCNSHKATAIIPCLFKHIILLSRDNNPRNKNEALSSWKLAYNFTKRGNKMAHMLCETTLPLSYVSDEQKQVYEYLFQDDKINPRNMKRLYEHYRAELDSELSRISARTKQSISFTAEAANAARSNLFKKSPCFELLELGISIEEDDVYRRHLEGMLLELMYERLNFTESGPAKQEMQLQLRDLLDRMCYFEPVTQLAYEISWDIEHPNLDSVRAELPKLKQKNGKYRKKESGELNSANIAYPIISYLQLFESAAKRSTLHDSLYYEIYGVDAPKPKGVTNVGQSVWGYMMECKRSYESNDYRSCLDYVHSGVKAAHSRGKILGIDFSDDLCEFDIYAARCYTFYEAPKNHNIALDLYNGILSKNPENIDALLGVSTICMSQGNFELALKSLETVLQLDEGNNLAKFEMTWIMILKGEYDQAIETLTALLGNFYQPLKVATIKWRIGYSYWMKGMKKESFTWFIDSLKSKKDYAPAFTYLGLYYSEVAKDEQRSQRCFFKALELDGGELVAGEMLAKDFADKSQWDLVEVIAKTSITAIQEKGIKNIDWPFRAMGIICLNQAKYAESVKYFQKSLKICNDDVESWIGLGETYINTGRFKSAERALCRALELDENNFSAYYILSIAQRESLDFPAAAESLRLAMKHAGMESSALKWAFVDNSIRAASYFVEKSMLGDALTETASALHAISELIKESPVDVYFGGAAEVFMKLYDIGCHSVLNIPDDMKSRALPLLETVGTKATNTLEIALAFTEEYIKRSENGTRVRKATSNHLAAVVHQRLGNIEPAIKHYQETITLESHNEQAWIGYGVLVSSIDPYVAQHCFVRALSLNGHNPDTWVNLGALYFQHDENIDLAEESVNRALSLDPELCRAWVLQAMIFEKLANHTDDFLCRTLEYAYSLDGSDTVASFAFALKEYNSNAKPREAPVGALERLLAVNPQDGDATLICGLLLERKGEYEAALEKLELINAVEHKCRILLALGRYEEVIREAESLSEDGNVQSTLTKYLTTGLASYFLGDLDSAITNFTEALNLSSDSEDILRLLVQVLYSSGSEDAREVAVEQLFDSIQAKGPTLEVVILLGVLGYLSKDEDVTQAAKDDLQKFINSDIVGDKLARACEIMGVLEGTNKYFKRAIFQSPGDFNLWKDIDSQQALVVASNDMKNSSQLSDALVNAGGKINCQRAAFLYPSKSETWKALESCM